MNIVFRKILNVTRRYYTGIVKPHYFHCGKPKIGVNVEYGNKLVREAIMSDRPIMIARLGTTECETVLNYLGVKTGKRSVWGYIKGKQQAWWWNGGPKSYMSAGAGFFPATDKNLERFGELMLDNLSQTDILIQLSDNEEYLRSYFLNAKRITLPSMEPWFSVNPWTKALKGKKVLVVHPFVDTFKKQYEKRERVWTDGLLPEFELLTIKAVQTVAGQKSEFNDWFEALDWMKSEIEKVNFEIAIIGCGAYGFPLAAYVKSIGKKAIHMGGATQLLFGVIGRRWENDPTQPFRNLINEDWVRPSEGETPQNSNIVEGACYW